MAEFALIDSNSDSIPFSGASVAEDALNFSNPDSILTGTQRGQQALGAPNIKTDSANQRIVVNDNTTNRVSFGRIGTGANDWGLKVSKPTFNVDTATVDQLIFNSSQNVFKIVSSSSISLTYSFSSHAATSSGADVATTTLSYNLSYTPIIMAFYTASSIYSPLSNGGTFSTNFSANSQVQQYFTFSGDATGASISFIQAFSVTSGTVSAQSGTFTIKYYLLQETAN